MDKTTDKTADEPFKAKAIHRLGHPRFVPDAFDVPFHHRAPARVIARQREQQK